MGHGRAEGPLPGTVAGKVTPAQMAGVSGRSQGKCDPAHKPSKLAGS